MLAEISWDLQGVIVTGVSDDERWIATWERLVGPARVAPAVADVTVSLRVDSHLPPLPAQAPAVIRAGEHYYVAGQRLEMHLPGIAAMVAWPSRARSELLLTPAAGHDEGLLEDILAVALAPHLRRRGRFLLHAFAAVHEGRGVLLVGDSGAGKTTTGLALLEAGWRMLGNDVAQYDAAGELWAYPGRIRARPAGLVRLPRLAALMSPTVAAGARVRFAPEAIWPACRTTRARVGAIFFLEIEGGAHSALLPLTAAEALGRLIPHTVDRWDPETLSAHLEAVEVLARAAPAYRLRLGEDVGALPALLAGVL